MLSFVNILTAICIAVYVIVIITSLIAKVKLNEGQDKTIDADISGGKLVETILRQFYENEIPEDNITENETNLDENKHEELSEEMVDLEPEYIKEDDDGDESEVQEDLEDEYDENGRKRFNYNTNKKNFQFESNEEINETTEIIKKEENEENEKQELKNKQYFATERIKGTLSYQIDKRKEKIKLSSDIYDSNSYTAIAIAGYLSFKFLIDNQKPIKYKLLNLILFIPKIISQIGWLIPLFYIFGEFPIDANILSIGMIITTGSVLLSLLNIFYNKYIASYTLNSLIENNIIAEKEKEYFSKIIFAMPYRELSNYLKFLRWCLKKLGYAI